MTAGFPLPHRPLGFSRARDGSVEKSLHASHTEILTLPARAPVPVHSAHIGQETEVHYRWHPLYGRRVKVRDIEQRGRGHVVHVESDPCVVKVIAAWMLDPAACSAMKLGEPRVTVAALCDLHQLLVDRHLRGNSPDDSNTVREKRNGQAAQRRSSRPAVAVVGAATNEHDVRPRRTSGDELGPAHKGNYTSCEPADAGRRRRHREGA